MTIIPNKPLLNTSTEANVLELLAEVPQVEVSRFAVGKLQIRKEIRTKTIELPITLTQEVLVIDHIPSHQFAQPLPATGMSHQTESSSDWDTWVKIDRDQVEPNAKIMLNGHIHEFNNQPLEVVISQEFAHVQIQTHLAETVRIATTTESHVETLPVTVRHEELKTEQVKFDTPQLVASSVIPQDKPGIK